MLHRSRRRAGHPRPAVTVVTGGHQDGRHGPLSRAPLQKNQLRRSGPEAFARTAFAHIPEILGRSGRGAWGV
eukprot:5564595-Alexandrium_andersonii.AAC.1